MKGSKLVTTVVMVCVIVVSVFAMSGCMGDWRSEQERTNQMQIHESGLTQRAAIDAAVTSNTVDSIMGNNK